MAASQPPFSVPADVALLHAIVRRDIAAVECALGAGAKLEWKGIPALHTCALCDWAEPMPLLRAAGACLAGGLVCMIYIYRGTLRTDSSCDNLREKNITSAPAQLPLQERMWMPAWRLIGAAGTASRHG